MRKKSYPETRNSFRARQIERARAVRVLERAGAKKKGGATAMKLETVNISNIRTVTVQSSRRTEDVAMSGIMKSYQETKFLEPPTLIKEGSGYYAVNGNRRIECARRAGLREMQCIVITQSYFSGTKETLFAHLNKSMRRPGGVEWLDGWAQARNPDKYAKVAPGVSQRTITWLKETFGEDEARQMIEDRKVVSTLHRCVVELKRILYMHKVRSEILDDRLIAEWIMTHKASGMVPRLRQFATKSIATAVAKCIEKNEPYTKRIKTTGSTSYAAPAQVIRTRRGR